MKNSQFAIVVVVISQFVSKNICVPYKPDFTPTIKIHFFSTNAFLNILARKYPKIGQGKTFAPKKDLIYQIGLKKIFEPE
jgi:hypothetical protein